MIQQTGSTRPARLLRRLANEAGRHVLPRRTVRLRLTVLYGVMFLLSGAVLLAITSGVVYSRSRRNLTVDRGGAGPDAVGDGAWVTGNQTLLGRMIDNVIDNAIGHNHDGGWIRVTTGTSGFAWMIVETGGPALDPRLVAQLAQPFRRMAADRTGSGQGAGLGLSIVSAIAAAHGGVLDLQARPEGGLRVGIGLPLAAHPAHAAPAGVPT